MTVVAGPLDAATGAPSYTGEMLRTTWAGGLVGGKTSARALGGFSGVWPGTASPISVSGSIVTIGTHGGSLDVETAANTGPYLYAVTVSETKTLNAADPTNPRIDLISITLSDPAAGDGTSTPGAVITYTAGTAASTPTVPSTPTRSMAIAQVLVPHSGGGSAVATWTAPYTVAAGGILPTTSATLPASPYEGMVCYELDTNLVVTYNGAAWVAGPQGVTTAVSGPATSADITTSATVMTTTAAVIAGRTYMVTGSIVGALQVTNAGTPVTNLAVTGAGVSITARPYYLGVQVNGNTGIYASQSFYVSPSSTGTLTLTFSASSTAAAYRTGVNTHQIIVEDMGP